MPEPMLRLWPYAVTALLLWAPAAPDGTRPHQSAPVSTQPHLNVMTTGAFSAAYRALLPEFERTSHTHVTTVEGGSMGEAPTTIPNRLSRGEQADLVILARPALDQLIAEGKVVEGSAVDLVRSRIGMAIRAGATAPDISSLDAFVRTLLAAKSLGYSSSASGSYLSKELFPQLGIAERLFPKTRRIDDGPVGAAIARGEVEIGFQQISELMPVPGITIVGPLPPGAQRETLFSAGVVAASQNVAGARALIRYFTSAAVADTIRQTGLEPLTTR